MNRANIFTTFLSGLKYYCLYKLAIVVKIVIFILVGFPFSIISGTMLSIKMLFMLPLLLLNPNMLLYVIVGYLVYCGYFKIIKKLSLHCDINCEKHHVKIDSLQNTAEHVTQCSERPEYYSDRVEHCDSKCRKILDDITFKERDGKYSIYPDLFKDKNMEFGNTKHQDIKGKELTCKKVCADQFISLSDVTLKKNIENIDKNDALNKINELQGVYYNWNDQDSEEPKNIGFIAQNVQKVVPELVKYVALDEGDKKLAVEYDKMVPLLVEAVKELSKKIK